MDHLPNYSDWAEFHWRHKGGGIPSKCPPFLPHQVYIVKGTVGANCAGGGATEATRDKGT